MILAGFDQAVRGIGWACGEPGAVPSRGWAELPDYGENTARLGRYVREWTINFIKSTGVQRGYFEQVLVRSHGFHMPVYRKQIRVADSIEIAFEMLGLMEEIYEVDIGDWRREFYRGARPPKNESSAWKDLAKIECARRGWLVDDHNAAEACGIWVFGCCHADRRFHATQKVHKRRAELERSKAEAA